MTTVPKRILLNFLILLSFGFGYAKAEDGIDALDNRDLECPSVCELRSARIIVDEVRLIDDVFPPDEGSAGLSLFARKQSISRPGLPSNHVCSFQSTFGSFQTCEGINLQCADRRSKFKIEKIKVWLSRFESNRLNCVASTFGVYARWQRAELNIGRGERLCSIIEFNPKCKHYINLEQIFTSNKQTIEYSGPSFFKVVYSESNGYELVGDVPSSDVPEKFTILLKAKNHIREAVFPIEVSILK